MTAEERALLPDPSSGSQHAIVLSDDTLRDDTQPLFGRHLRVKILSGLWRGIGDVEIPYEAKSLLIKWWAHIIPPEGPTIEIGKDDLIPVVVARRGGARLRMLKLALPRMMAGSILDIGFLYRATGSDFVTVNLQQPWPVKHLRYFWAPDISTPSQYHLLRRPGLQANVTRDKDSLLLDATDLPLFVEEPWSPPETLIRAGAVFHYTYDQPNADPNVFWDAVARGIDKRVVEVMKDDDSLQLIMKKIDLTGPTLESRLRAAYAWIETNVRNTYNLTTEEDDQRRADSELQLEKEKRAAYAFHRRPDTFKDILESHEASPDALDRLFLCIARAVGAQANLTLAADRQFEFWDRTLYTRFQFSSVVVAVRAPGEPVEKAVFVDPGWGQQYGVLDWRLTASRALMATPQGAREVTIPHQTADSNRMNTQAQIRFDTDGGAESVVWSASGTGQRGREERSEIRTALPGERDQELRKICGEGPAMEVLSADAPGWQGPSGDFSLACEADLATLAPGQGQATHSMRFFGPWIPEMPAPLASERTHPIVFPYPREDHTEIRVQAPPGFDAATAPSPVKLTSPFGEYLLVVRPVERGFDIERRLVITALTVRADQYADLRRFLQDVRRADQTRLKFLRQDAKS
jgi:hypothetical protein